MKYGRKIISCHKASKENQCLYDKWRNKSNKEEFAKALFLEFHRVFKNIPTDKLDRFVVEVIEQSHIVGSVAERVVLDILLIEKDIRTSECKTEGRIA